MKFTSIVFATASGSAGGCTYSHNRYGLYIRNRSIPVNPSSSFQSVVRSALAAATQAWSADLTQEQRDGWDAYAAQVPKGGQNVLGINWFVANNVPRIQASLALIEDAPTILTGTSLTPPTNVNAIAGDQEVEFDITLADPWNAAAGGSLFVYISRGFNATRNFFKGPYRFAERTAGAQVAVDQDAPAPFAFEVGQRVGVRFVAQTADGRLSAPYATSVIAI